VVFCNGNGKVIRKPFSIKNSPQGLEYLIDQVMRSCRHHRIDMKHIFFGGEDCGTYADNFINTLHSENWLVAGGLEPCDVQKAIAASGAYKINNTLDQALPAKFMGKKKLIAETGAGQHGVATAKVATLFKVGGGSNAMGQFYSFLKEEVRIKGA